MFIYIFNILHIYVFLLKCLPLQLTKDMEQFRIKGSQLEQEHQSLLQDIDKQLKEVESRAEAYKDKASIIGEILGKLKTGLICFTQL